MIRKLLNFISGILTPAAAFMLLREFLLAKKWNMIFLAVFLLSLIMYLLTGADRDRYGRMPVWKRVLRLFMFPVLLLGALISISGFSEGNTVKGAEYLIISVVLTAVYYALFKPGFVLSEKEIENMDGRDFEEYCAKILKRNGFRRVFLTQASNDYGADITAYKRGEKWVIQCKRYQIPIGNSSVQEVVAAMGYYDAKRAAVMTNSTFTRNAAELALENDVLLIDGTELQKMSRA